MAERARLGRFLGARAKAAASGSDDDRVTAPERLRTAFEELGPTFVKLGQLLASRPDLVPEDYVREFEKLHDRVQPLPFDVVEGVLKDEFGARLTSIFTSIDPNPLGSASIAQVHRARLATGEDVVVKVQRPGIVRTISDDIGMLYMLADLLAKYVPETRPYNPRAIVDEFFKTLELEVNFIIEANNIRRFAQNFSTGPLAEKIVIPKVHFDLTTERVLVMEALNGIPISQDEALRQPGTDAPGLIRTGLQAYLKSVYIDGLFHGDLHAGNFFVMPDNRVGLIDFGIVGRLTPKTQAAIASMLIALSKEDYERMALEYVDLAPFTDRVNVDLFARELRELIAPYYGLTLKNFNLGKVLMSSAGIAARHHLQVPTELMLFFKSIIAIEGLGRRIDRDFDFLKSSLEFAGDLVKHQMDPARMMSDLGQVTRESKVFLASLPRQLSFFVRKLNSPEHAFRTEIRGLDDLRQTVDSSFRRLSLGVLISALVVSASHVATVPGAGTLIAGLPVLSFSLFTAAAVLCVVALYNWVRN